MPLIATLLRASPALFAAAFAAALVCGLGGAALVMLINAALNTPPERLVATLIPFVLVAVLVMTAQAGSRALFAHLGQRCLGRIRREIAEAILRAPYQRLERVGQARMRSAFSDDAVNIANFGVGFPVVVTNLVVVLGALGYLAWLSLGVFAVALVLIALGSFGYHLSHRKVVEHLRRAGFSQDRLYGDFDALLGGAKELKLNETKARRFLDRDLAGAIGAVGTDRARGLSLLALSDGWGRFLFMFLIGVALFARLWLPGESAGIVTGYVIAFLYLMGPLEGVLAHLPYVNLARVAIGRVQGVLSDLAAEPVDPSVRIPETPRSITLEGVTHGYFREREEDVFTLGPIDLTLVPGEATFVVGGNGSGKTTLAKLVTGLYAPEGGRIRVDGAAVGDAGRQAYRQLFSAIYADFQLFETLLEAPSGRLDARANEWLAKLHLDRKVTVSDGAFSTRDLSQGQRKRLALVAACVEDRPVMVFDEWAADQDPAFKDVFYRELLPELKARGKTLVVITHDDRYFDLADRLVKLEGGRIVETGPSQPREPIDPSVAALRLAAGGASA
ncbi:cyclic peptide export ABC transporter [Methylopila sp. Yamaguchi]|uniref:cyclic peptide export ABC transporter n=1 Tax=Methylopila sp. Yamaguchi TaxID=1437817 RepID=UPI000CC0A4E2|nr:cyclic peptide export ABC transporter [Methylopila sp. Yamaguchi]GBD49887.1 cyclic peptide transporter [Methylopila sp. Yamaguchi]